MRRLIATSTAAIGACLVLPFAALWITSAAGAPWWLTLTVANVALVATCLASLRVVRRAGERARAEIRANAERECAEIRRLHGGGQ